MLINLQIRRLDQGCENHNFNLQETIILKLACLFVFFHYSYVRTEIDTEYRTLNNEINTSCFHGSEDIIQGFRILKLELDSKIIFIYL